MDDKDLYSGLVPPRKQAEYKKWLAARGQAPTSMPDRAALDQERAMAELREIENRLADLLRAGAPAEGSSVVSAIQAHHRWVEAMWGKPCPPEAYTGLADIYATHPDFVARYERIETGFAAFLVRAMKAWAPKASASGPAT